MLARCRRAVKGSAAVPVVSSGPASDGAPASLPALCSGRGSATLDVMTRPRPGVRWPRWLWPTLLLCSCRSIPDAPADAPRVEVEVDVAFAEDFRAALQDPDEALVRAIEEAVLREADVGLRFYPVRSADYGEGQARPDYRLAVRVERLVAELGMDAQTQTQVLRRVETEVDVALGRRRADGPTLVVARSSQGARRRPVEADVGVQEASYTVAAGSPGGVSGVSVPRATIVAAVREAVNEALSQMVRAIDREFAQSRPQI